MAGLCQFRKFSFVWTHAHLSVLFHCRIHVSMWMKPQHNPIQQRLPASETVADINGFGFYVYFFRGGDDDDDGVVILSYEARCIFAWNIWEPNIAQANARWSILNCCRCHVMCCQHWISLHIIELVPNSCSVQCNPNKWMLVCFYFAHFLFSALLIGHGLYSIIIYESWRPTGSIEFYYFFQKWTKKIEKKSLCITT